MIIKNPFTISLLAGCGLLLGLTACNGIAGGLYDEPKEDNPAGNANQLRVDATSWTDWYYIDFDSLATLAAAVEANPTDDAVAAALHRAQTTFTPWPIPTEAVSSSAKADAATANAWPATAMANAAPNAPAITVGQSSTRAASNAEAPGIYTYWYDCFGEGLKNNRFENFYPTAPQPEPDHWSIAIHRNNVRTNGAEVLETSYTSMDDLPLTSGTFTGLPFTADEWTENVVWVDQSRLLQCYVGNQGIKINNVLSSWLTVNLPPIPPTFTMNSHVFLIRFPNGKVAAVQLVNYMNAASVKCHLTINYKYPY